jgi:hypothetical protein
LFAKEKRCGAPLPTALHKTFFGLRRQSEATTALFHNTRFPEEEKPGTFVQLSNYIKRLAPTVRCQNSLGHRPQERDWILDER